VKSTTLIVYIDRNKVKLISIIHLRRKCDIILSKERLFKGLRNAQEEIGLVRSVGSYLFLLKKRGRGRPKKSK